MLAENFVKRFPEFSLKKIERNGEELYLDNSYTGFDFNHELSSYEFISKNLKTKDRDSKSFNNLYFQIEFILTTNNKIKDIKILNSIDNSYDSDYVNSLKQAEPYFKNLTDKDLIIRHEVNHSKWTKDLKDNDEIKLHNLHYDGSRLYFDNKFEDAIKILSKIKDLKIKNNKFEFLIEESMKFLGISYLAVGKTDEACDAFNQVGDITDFEVRNYLLDFCSE